MIPWDGLFSTRVKDVTLQSSQNAIALQLCFPLWRQRGQRLLQLLPPRIVHREDFERSGRRPVHSLAPALQQSHQRLHPARLCDLPHSSPAISVGLCGL
jgi:hypothetical protein